MSAKKRFTILFIFVIIPTLSVAYVSADTVYVHPTDGEFTSIADAIVAATRGDTILVGPGEYASFVVSKMLLIISEEGPETTKINTNGSIKFTDESDASKISGFTITISSSSGIEVQSNWNKIRVENNIITGCGGNGILVYASASSSLISNMVIQNNTIAYNSGHGIYLRTKTGTYDGKIQYCSVINNILFRNTNYGISANQPNYTTSCTFANNSFWGNVLGSQNGITASQDDGNLFADPLFISPETSDFRLQASSNCIDAGKISSVYNDPDGTRNDMGIYGGPGAANFWPSPAGGPVVIELSVTPPSVAIGETLNLRATGKIR